MADPTSNPTVRCFRAVRYFEAYRPKTQEPNMNDVAKVTEIIASSKKSFVDAVDRGIARASKTLKGVQGAWIENMKVVVSNGKVVEYRVNMRVTFILKD